MPAELFAQHAAVEAVVGLLGLCQWNVTRKPLARNAAFTLQNSLMKPKILVIDEKRNVFESIKVELDAAGFTVLASACGAKTLKRARRVLPSLIVLEVTSPEGAALELGKSFRRDSATSAIPLLLIATAADIDRVLGSELAPNDFVTKPFRPPELVLRIKELLRRDQLRDGTAPRIRLGELSVDIPRHEVTVNGHQIDLTAIELKLITLLAQRRGLVQSRDQLLRDVWEHESFTDTRTVDTHMCRLRDKLGPAAKYIETIRSFGYRFVEE